MAQLYEMYQNGSHCFHIVPRGPYCLCRLFGCSADKHAYCSSMALCDTKFVFLAATSISPKDIERFKKIKAASVGSYML